jgi:hypothetical protein
MKWHQDSSQDANGHFLLKTKAQLLKGQQKNAGEGECFQLAVRYFSVLVFGTIDLLSPVKWATWG